MIKWNIDLPSRSAFGKTNPPMRFFPLPEVKAGTHVDKLTKNLAAKGN